MINGLNETIKQLNTTIEKLRDDLIKKDKEIKDLQSQNQNKIEQINVKNQMKIIS